MPIIVKPSITADTAVNPSSGLTVNGVSLQTYAFNIVNRSGRWSIAARRGGNLDLPGLHGTSKLSGKPFDENTVVLTMWVVGALPDGSLPKALDKRAQVEQYVDMLGRLFTAPTVTLVQNRTDGPRQLVGEVVKAIDFTSMAGATRAEFGVEILASQPFWRALSPTSQTVVTSSAMTATFDSFKDVTAPVIEGQFTITGPVSSPVLTNPVTGQWVKLNRALAQGDVWTLDSGLWASAVNGQNAIADTSHGVGATFLDLTPDITGPKIVLGGTEQASSTSIRLTARKAYLSA